MLLGREVLAGQYNTTTVSVVGDTGLEPVTSTM